MTTTATIESAVKLAVLFKGSSPISGGALSLNTDSVATTTFATRKIRSHRLTYSDLVVSSTNRIYRVIYKFDVSEDATTEYNIAGEFIDLNSIQKMVYIHSNVALATSGGVPVPTVIPANGEVFLRGSFDCDPGPVDNGDLILQLLWTQAALDAAGTSNFVCDLIIAS